MSCSVDSSPIWEGEKDFGNGVRRYRIMDISTQLSMSDFQYLNERLGWRQCKNYDVRLALYKFAQLLPQDPF